MNVSQRKEKMSTIYKIFDIEELRIAVVGLLDPLSIIRLSGTNRRLRSVLYTASSKHWNIGRWDIDVHLKRFVDDPKLFREMLGRCGAIVSGSNALQFLDGVYYAQSDMDVFFDDLKSLAEFGDYVTRGEVYAYDRDRKRGQPPDWVGMRAKLSVDPYEPYMEMEYRDVDVNMEVVCFSRTSPGRKIQLIWSRRGVFEAVVGFDSTLVMNFFTWNASFSLFPWLTFYERRGIKSGARRTEVQKERDRKYVERGFGMERKILRRQLYELVEERDFRRRRALVDRYTWCLPFDVDGVDRPQVADTVPLDVTFKLQKVDGFLLKYGKVKRDDLLLRRILSMSYERDMT